MEQAIQSARVIRFANFEADLEAGELRKHGRKVSLQEQPFQVLTLLLLHAGKPVTREDLQKRLWPAETFVDFDLGLNTAIKKLRAALKDSAENPRFIETLPRKGYRFVCPVEAILLTMPAAQPLPVKESNPESLREMNGTRLMPATDRTWRERSEPYRLGLALGILAIVLVSVGFGFYRLYPRSRSSLTRDFAVEKLQDRGTQVAVAYEAYLKGTDFLQADDLENKGEKAAQSFAEAVRLDPSYALAYAGLGEADWSLFQATGNDEWQTRAQHSCNKALELDGARAAPHICVATIHLGMGQYERAVQDFSEAIAIDARNAAAFRGRAKADEGLGNIGEAEKDYLQAINLDPGNWAGYASLAGFYFDRGRYQEAAQTYERSIAMKPDNSQPHFALGAVYVEMGQYEKAITVLQEAVRLKPSFGAYENLGTVFFNARRFEDSIQSFKKALELDGSDYRGYGNLARAYFWAPGHRKLAQENYERAISLARQKLTVNPEDPDINLNLSVYYAMLGQGDDALYHLHRSQELQPASGETDFWAGIVNLQLGYKEKALAWLRQANALNYSAEIDAVPELDRLRSDAEFKRLLLGRGNAQSSSLIQASRNTQ